MNDYEWDEQKRQENADKHDNDIDFTAIYDFEWDTALSGIPQCDGRTLLTAKNAG